MGLRDPGVLQGDAQSGGRRDRQRIRRLPGQPGPPRGHRAEGVREARRPHHRAGRLRHGGGQRVHQHHDGHPHRARRRDPRSGARIPVLRPVHQLLRGQDRVLQADRGGGLEAGHRHDPQEDHQQDQGPHHDQPQQPHRGRLRREDREGGRGHRGRVRHPADLRRDLRQDHHGGQLLLRFRAARRHPQGRGGWATATSWTSTASWTRSARA